MWMSALLAGETETTTKKVIASWNDFFKDYSKTQWLGKVFEVISIVMYIIMGLVGAAGAIYAIYLGIKLARADESGQREECKKHLITVCIAVAVTIVFVLFFNILLPMLVGAIIGQGMNANGDLLNSNGNVIKKGAQIGLNFIKSLL